MIKQGLVIPVFLAFFVSSTNACDGNGNRKKIVGTWYPVAGENKVHPIEFSKDGKVTIHLPTKIYGTYTVMGNVLVAVVVWPEEKYTAQLTIEKLTDSELVLESRDWKKSYTFRKRK